MAVRANFVGVNVRSKFRIFEKCETLNGRLPPEDGSVRPQTLGKCVSDDPRHFIFRRRKTNFGPIFSTKIFAGVFFVWLEDTCVLARRHICPGQKTHVSWPE